MRFNHLIGAAGMAIGFAFAAPALAAPSSPADTAAGNLDIIQVQRDCHADVRRHYLPEYGRRVAHFHRGRNCRPVLAGNGGVVGPRDCHRGVERHYLPQYGRSIYHRHVGPSCRVQTFRESRDRREGCFRVGPVTVCP